MPREAPPLDTTIEIVTPENIAFQYRLAGPFRRLNAYLIDLVIRCLIAAALFLVGLSLGLLSGVWVAVLLIAWFVLEWFYGGVFETYWNGQTPGKRLVGIRTLTVEGQPINGMQAVLRNILRSVDTMPWLSLSETEMYLIPTYALGLLTMALNPRFQRIGDVVCGTMVVVEERRWFRGVIKVDEPRAIELAEQIPADFQPSRTLARAVAAYVERRHFFSLARRQELSRPLGRQLVTRLGLPLETSDDLLLCAVYRRVFLADGVKGGQA